MIFMIFINKENNIAKIIHCENSIISPGGSIIYSEDSINHFKNNLNSEIIHLELSYDEFIKRIDNLNNRGVVIKNKHNLKDFYEERMYLYNLYSDRIINVDNKDYIYNNIEILN